MKSTLRNRHSRNANIDSFKCPLDTNQRLIHKNCAASAPQLRLYDLTKSKSAIAMRRPPSPKSANPIGRLKRLYKSSERSPRLAQRPAATSRQSPQECTSSSAYRSSLMPKDKLQVGPLLWGSITASTRNSLHCAFALLNVMAESHHGFAF